MHAVRDRISAIWNQRPVIILSALFALGLLTIFLLIWRPTVERVIEPHAIAHNNGYAYLASLKGLAPRGYRLVGDDMGLSHRSRVLLLRDGAPIGWPHSLHDEIRNSGQGRYSHWQHHFYFSTPDNADPRRDGRRYSITATTTHSPLLASVLYTSLTLTTVAILTGVRATLLANRAQWARRAVIITAPIIAVLFRGWRGRVLALLVVFTAAATTVNDNWHEYYITPDSHSYLANLFVEPSIRPPIVSTWLELFSDRSLIERRMDEIVKLGGVNKPQVGVEDDPILPAIQAQRLFLLISFLILAFAATIRMSSVGAVLGMSAAAAAIPYIAPSAVTALLAVLGLLAVLPLIVRLTQRADRGLSLSRTEISTTYKSLSTLLVRAAVIVAIAYFFLAPILQHSFLSDQQQFLMSEALSMSWQLLFAACALYFIWKRNGIALVGAAVFAALAYLTRSASVFLFFALGVLLVLALFYDRRSFVRFGLGAIAAAAMLIYAVPITWAVRGEPSAPTAPMLNWGPMAFAVEVAQPGDDRWLPDSESKRFFATALRMRDQASSGRQASPAYRSVNLGANLYRVALPAASETLSHASGKNIDELFGKVARPILEHRAIEYASVVGEAAVVATGLRPDARTTRLFESAWHWLALIILVAFAFWGTERDVQVGIAATLLIGMHLIHVGIVSAFDAPLSRYVYATEIFVVLAIVLLVDHQIRVISRAGVSNWRRVGSGR